MRVCRMRLWVQKVQHVGAHGNRWPGVARVQSSRKRSKRVYGYGGSTGVQRWRSNGVFGKRRNHVALPVRGPAFWSDRRFVAVDETRRNLNVAADHEGGLRARGAVAEGEVHRQERAKCVHWKGRREKIGAGRKLSFQLFSPRKIPRRYATLTL